MEPIVAKINGQKQHFKSRHELARCLMDLLEYSVSPLAVRAENLIKIMTLTGFDRKAKFIGNITTEERFTAAWWETVLSLEHKGTLPGFSVNASAKNGSSNYNPECRRISTNWRIE